METKKIMIEKEFTVEAAGKFREASLLALSKGPTHFEVDFRNCTFIDSTGLGVLVSLLKRCKEQGSSLTLYNLNQDLMRIVHMTRLDQVFDIR